MTTNQNSEKIYATFGFKKNGDNYEYDQFVSVSQVEKPLESNDKQLQATFQLTKNKANDLFTIDNIVGYPQQKGGTRFRKSKNKRNNRKTINKQKFKSKK
jgi:hypothetical protein